MTQQRLPAEWEPQDAILLAWPIKGSEWEYLLDDVTQLYEALVSVICDYADVVIAIHPDDIESVRQRLELMEVPLEYVYFHPVEHYSSLIRRFGPVGVQTDQGIRLLSFVDSEHTKDLKQSLVAELFEQQAFPSAVAGSVDFAIDPRSIEVDGQGILFTCHDQQSANHSQLSQSELEEKYKALLGVSKINWLSSYTLVGQSAPCSIDMLVRCCPNNVLVYTACDDEKDENYQSLKKFEAELKTMTNAQGSPFVVLPLPWPGEILKDDDSRAPATYASFVVVNEAVLVPIFNSLSDEDALEIISKAFPGFEVFGIPSNILFEKNVNLHGIAMQLPEGVLMQALV